MFRAFAYSHGQHVMKKLTIVIVAAVLCASFRAGATDVGERRLSCQEEARQHIRPRRIDLDLYMRVVERRQLYARDCMTAGMPDVEQTGTLAVPLPPKRPMTAAPPRPSVN